MIPVVLALPGNEPFALSLSAMLSAELGVCETRRFPDGETYVRVDTSVTDRQVIIVCTLDRPDDKFLPLFFLAATARDLGASRVGLICPYLPYMRQDNRFHGGEGVTSVYFAEVLSRSFDWIVTVDPHLHRRRNLSEIYRVPVIVAHAAPVIAEWIRANVPSPVVVGPDEESAQWVAAVAAAASAPHFVLRKHRGGDRQVEISQVGGPDRSLGTPVLLDDIISSGQTMVAAVSRLREAGYPDPYCVAVHAVFSDRADKELIEAGARAIVTCNTIPHPSNAIAIDGVVATAVREVDGSVTRPLEE